MSIRKWDFPGQLKKHLTRDEKEKATNKPWNTLLLELEGTGDITLKGSQQIALLLEKTLKDLR